MARNGFFFVYSTYVRGSRYVGPIYRCISKHKFFSEKIRENYYNDHTHNFSGLAVRPNFFLLLNTTKNPNVYVCIYLYMARNERIFFYTHMYVRNMCYT